MLFSIESSLKKAGSILSCVSSGVYILEVDDWMNSRDSQHLGYGSRSASSRLHLCRSPVDQVPTAFRVGHLCALSMTCNVTNVSVETKRHGLRDPHFYSLPSSGTALLSSRRTRSNWYQVAFSRRQQNGFLIFDALPRSLRTTQH